MREETLDFDRGALMARLREGDEDAIARAYNMTFSGDVGRFVLAHMMAEAGIGQIRGRDMTRDERIYLDGAGDHAMAIVNRAGFDQPAAIVTVLTETLETYHDERSPDPEPALGD